MEKLLFIDHSFHAHTKSSQFIIDILCEQYDVNVIFDDNWRSGKDPDVSQISLEYDVIVFFQIIPSPREFKKIIHPNIVFFPMFDHSHETSLLTWLTYRNIKIINFSKTLHDKLKKWGFNSFYVQYFSKLQNAITSINNKVFFWQRINDININTVCELFENSTVQIHLHSCVDPHHTLLTPTSEQKKQYGITFSQWFEARHELESCIAANTFYIAPRISEGIGMSFLEAMAQGMIVVSNDAPTMNEYIVHGENGFLFDYKKPVSLDLKSYDLEKISHSAREHAQKGYSRWTEHKNLIFSYLQEESKPFKFLAQTYKYLLSDAFVVLFRKLKRYNRKLFKIIRD